MREKRKDRNQKSRRLTDDDIMILMDDDLDARLERLPSSQDEERGQRRQPAKKTTPKKAVEKKPKKSRKKVTNKEFARITYLFVSLFLVLMGYIVYFNAVKAKTIINSPYNMRQDIFADRVIRGKILDKNGEVLAKTTVGEDGKETREYPYGDLYSHVVGYASKGKAGLESVENFNLLTSNAFVLEKIMKEFKGEKNIGDNVVTTLDTNLQQAAYDALGDNKGAVVVMEADTGKILSLVSKPTFDPNFVAENWAELNQDKDSAMLNRAMQGKYAPGSTFKIVTALEYIRENSDYDSYQYKCTSKIEHEGTVIHCNNNKVHGMEDLRSSFANLF